MPLSATGSGIARFRFAAKEVSAPEQAPAAANKLLETSFHNQFTRRVRRKAQQNKARRGNVQAREQLYFRAIAGN
jgi:hypothetical protein